MINYRFLQNENLWVPHAAEHFDYTDGMEVEERIYRIVCSVKDRSTTSNELKQFINDWPSEYHLSAVRNNLLRPFAFGSQHAILEIGCGCGAMTRYLGETGAQTIAVEGSFNRARIAAERCRDLSNVQVVCDNFQNFSSDQKFDVVTLIGVLEYARLFIDGEDPIQSMLQLAASFLKDDGVLLIAIENQLGLKYFNAAGEDHSGVLFEGINDLYDETTAVTFGREELRERLHATAFKQVEFIYPFPDYKLPNLLVQESGLRDRDFRIGELIALYKSRDYCGQNNRLFSEERCWPLLERNGLIGDLSNSFLAVAGKSSTVGLTEWSGEWLAKTFSTSRKPHYWTANTFFRGEEGRLTVRKQRLLPAMPESASIPHEVGEEPYVQGQLLISRAWGVTLRSNPAEAFVEYLGEWMAYLRRHVVELRAENGVSREWLPGRLIDCTPMNLILDSNGEPQYIDAECNLTERIPLSWVFIRGIINHYYAFSAQDWKLILAGRRPIDVLLDAANQFGLAVNEEELHAILLRESELHSRIFDRSAEQYLDEMQMWLYKQDDFFFRPSELVDSRFQHAISVRPRQMMVQVFYSTDDDFDEERSLQVPILQEGTFQTYEFLLPSAQASRLRFDPVNALALLEIRSIELHAAGERLFCCSASNQFAGLGGLAGLVVLTTEGTLSCLSTNCDPNFKLEGSFVTDAPHLLVRVEMAAVPQPSVRLAEITVALTEREVRAEELQKRLDLANQELGILQQSISWRVTKPLRGLSAIVRRITGH